MKSVYLRILTATPQEVMLLTVPLFHMKIQLMRFQLVPITDYPNQVSLGNNGGKNKSGRELGKLP